MIRQLLLFSLSLAWLSSLYACGSAPTRPTTVGHVDDAPCWVKRPDCRAKPNDRALYFVGQSKSPLASWGRPQRASVHSAQNDAEQQYARYLGVEIQSSIFLQQVLEDERYVSQFNHTLRSNVDRTVSDLVKADEFFAAYEYTSDNQPKWTVYVLIKIEKETVARHKAAIEEEAKRRANAPPPEAQWTARVFNLDDGASIFVNGQKVNQCGFSRSCTVKLNAHFKPGTNEVRLDFINRLLFWTYGYEIKRDDEVMYHGRCGQVWVYGCGFSVKRGVVQSLTFQVEYPTLNASSR
ncbi:MAG: hypothetical protein VX589_10455 [Myxococcota bacterium]|nr:hypothetical protein [Myxococcota bacterium]